MKALFCGLLAVMLVGVSSGQEKPDFVNKTGEISVPDLGNWKLEKGSEVAEEGRSSFKLIVPGENIHAQVKILQVKAGFDVMKPEFRNQIKAGLSQGGMQVVASGQSSFAGQKAFTVHTIQLEPREGKDLVIHIVSISATFGDKFLTISLSDDTPDLLSNTDVLHLLKKMKVTPK